MTQGMLSLAPMSHASNAGLDPNDPPENRESFFGTFFQPSGQRWVKGQNDSGFIHQPRNTGRFP